MNKWEPLPISEKLFTNVEETTLTKASAAIENAFINEAGGHSRFPGLVQVADLGIKGRVYLSKWKDDIIAVSSGQVFRVNEGLTVENVTGVPVQGGGRVTFGGTEKELVMAAGDDIVYFAGERTKLLGGNPPHATHVAYVEGYVIAAVADEATFQHSAANDAMSWDDLDVFSANVKPDRVNAVAVSPYGELLVCGVDSIEQYERLSTGTVPFYRRWAAGEGLYAPYTLISDKDGNWGVNNRYEFVRFTGQSSKSSSDDIGRSLQRIDNWKDAWAQQMSIEGQQFMLLQMPEATNVYGTKGVTIALDYRQGKWFSLYGWDDELGVPARWPGWSYLQLWGRHFVGSGDGKLLELKKSVYSNAGKVQRVYGRTAHISKFGEVEVANVRLRVKRGSVAQGAAEPFISMRACRDNRVWTRWVRRSLGKTGDRAMHIEFGPMGIGNTFQFEWFVTDECEFETVEMEAQLFPVGD